jgi:hypothetical protein
MTNRELYFRDPTTIELLNNGVSKVSEIGNDERQIKTLRFELETFVCDGEYARGLERILKAYLDGLGREEQKSVWVSGFFGSGKSHLVSPPWLRTAVPGTRDQLGKIVMSGLRRPGGPETDESGTDRQTTTANSLAGP